ncbi:MAG TPA: signal peptidase I [Polyangiaceae bacterium]|nr:signal peptidase I [Polyangiaceae bacterium]
MFRTHAVRFAFAAVWFFLVPAALAYALLGVLTSPGVRLPLSDFAREQSVPAGIALFTLLELMLYSFRHRLPFARFVAVAGRHGVPVELRAELEQALRLLGEADAMVAKHGDAMRAQLGQADHERALTVLEDARAATRAEPVDAARLRDSHAALGELVSGPLSRWKKNELLEYAGSIGTALVVALLLRAVVVEAFKIPSGSMLPTLQIGDHIFVNKFLYGPKLPLSDTRVFERMPPRRGDIIVFSHPVPALSPDDLIKRVIALPGDVLEVDSGHAIINGWRVPSCPVGSYTVSEDAFGASVGELFVEYLEGTAYLAFYDRDQLPQRQGPYTVRQGEVWVMGDNRHHSADSRVWPNGAGLGRGVPFGNIKGRAMFVWAPLSRMFVDLMGSPVLPDGAPAEVLQAIAACLAKRPSSEETIPPPGKAALQALGG